MADNCAKCKFYKDTNIFNKASGFGLCRRHPSLVKTDALNWCGEFVAKSKKNTKGMVSFDLGAPLRPETDPEEQMERRWSSGINYADPVHQEDFTDEDRAAFPKINEIERIADLEDALGSLEKWAQTKPHHFGETPREHHLHAAICKALETLKDNP